MWIGLTRGCRGPPARACSRGRRPVPDLPVRSRIGRTISGVVPGSWSTGGSTSWPARRMRGHRIGRGDNVRQSGVRVLDRGVGTQMVIASSSATASELVVASSLRRRPVAFAGSRPGGAPLVQPPRRDRSSRSTPVTSKPPRRRHRQRQARVAQADDPYVRGARGDALVECGARRGSVSSTAEASNATRRPPPALYHESHVLRRVPAGRWPRTPQRRSSASRSPLGSCWCSRRLVGRLAPQIGGLDDKGRPASS